MSLGVYPKVGLKETRVRHAEAHDLVDRRIDPLAQKEAAQQSARNRGDTFEPLAREWYAKHSRDKGGGTS